ncbi:MAG TPA: HAMP domain-containing sensor histidine kinase [Thermoleophilaceae bacterium]
MSLRARLVIGLLVLAAAGLITLAAVTYAEQRSFLYDRVDQQIAAAVQPVSHQLDETNGTLGPQGTGFGPGSAHHPGYGDQGGPPPNVDLPPGTFGQRRDVNGARVGKNVAITYGEGALSPPKLPKAVPLRKALTVDSVDGSVKYRVEAFAGDGSGSTVVAVPLRDVTSTLHRLERVEALVIAGVLLALGLLSWWVVRLGLRPLDRMGATAGAIAAGELSQRVTPATQRTEVGRLGLALNEMLSQIETAFAERTASENRLRRFLADASHELRTPLVSIRGYAELFRLGPAREPKETEKAMQRIEEEAKRMGVLVEDMLTLARLDELREPVREPVELRRVALDAVADARAVAPGRRIEFDAEDAGSVLGDPHQLRQVVANLMRNALTHTPADSPIEVRVTSAGDDALLEVRDHGRGLPPGDPAELFERFWRAEKGRERGSAGAGLGLAIVAAIVDGHGGSVSAANADGGGASFVIRLPAHRPAAVASPQPS